MSIQSNYNSNQFHSGPGGAITGSEIELVNLYALLAESSLNYANDDVKIASEMSQAASIANQKAGEDQAEATRCQAIQSTVDAGLTAASAAGTLASSWKLNSQASAEQGEVKKLEKLNSDLQDSSLKNSSLRLQRQTVDSPARSGVVEERINELKAGKYLTTSIPGSASSPTGDWVEEINKQAAEAMKPEELEKVRGSLETVISNKYESINSKFSRIQQMNGYINQASQLGNQITASATQFVQANWQAKQGVEQGNAALASTSSSIANSALENQRSQNANYFAMIANVLQALKAAVSAYTA